MWMLSATGRVEVVSPVCLQDSGTCLPIHYKVPRTYRMLMAPLQDCGE